MLTNFEAVYENGVLRPLSPLPFAENERVKFTVARDEPDAEEDEEEGDWLDNEYMDACGKKADHTITIEQVREALSKIKGSMDDAINEDRGEY